MSISRKFSTVAVKTIEQWNNISKKVDNKIKGTIVEKWMKYWRQIARDYTDVTISLKQDMKDKPLKSAVYISGLGSLAWCTTHNPNLQSFRAKYVQCANDLALVDSNVANPTSLEHLRHIERCFNANLIRYMNLGIMSIIWVDNYSNECNTYESNCSYLKVPYRRFTDHILDVGFLNVWWVVSRKMLDYDINY